MLGYFKLLAEWTIARTAILKDIRKAYKAYKETQKKPWLSFSRSRRLKNEQETEERLQELMKELSDHEHTKPTRPDETRELFDFFNHKE